MMTKHTPCPICNNAKQNVVIEHRSSVPTLQNTTLATVEEAMAYPTGALEIVQCSQCSFVWNAAFDEKIILYDDDYNNDVSTSDYYRQHLEAMVDRVLSAIPDGEELHYVEIGCGEGDFMRLIMEKAGARCASATGFDPSFTNDSNLPRESVVHKIFFSPDRLDLIPEKTNVICSRHTIEHVADVQSFAQALCAPMTHEAVRLFVETPDANWILKNVAFQDFFYEHCSLYTPRSIQRLLAGYGVLSQVSPVYDGQYMWVEAELGNTVEASPISNELANDYVEEQSALMARWSDYIAKRNEAGPVAVWGAASKGVTFALLFADDDKAQIDCAIDLNTAKQNRFLPVTGMPVVDPQTARNRGVQTIVIMNPNYETEIKATISGLEWSPEVITLNS